MGRQNLGYYDPKLSVIKTEYQNLSIIPATIELAGAEIELLEVEKRESALRRVIEPLYDDYDFIFTANQLKKQKAELYTNLMKYYKNEISYLRQYV